MTDDRHERSRSARSARPVEGQPAGKSVAGIGTDARRRIGRDLRLFYASVLDQPLSERFTRLIDELAADPRNRKGSE